ncbi:PREDICTED: senescence-associated carboxylesterase 101-like isoform X1 [Camelina sativa]|uniref:Senescence-associated carboxylesterase 101-like isoform X1 n=1 Tax=Camelina sativa TaxID=90675 RepID=A0ABM0XX93_CAMSA|nr:PREDICTED: senescence-associated carboxylesterase 101-like isoform X1 [Camelina sativa]
MDSSSLKGFELGKLVLRSGLLQSSWSKISHIHESPNSNQDSGLGVKFYKEGKSTFVVFGAPPIRRNRYGLTRLSGSEYENNPFHFLCSEKISSFSVHTPSFELFASAFHRNLRELKSKLLELLKLEKPVIITGAALGGSVASLFTLWLLETIDPKLKRPLCITFGSPLTGDASLQQILENSLRNACFLHVAEAAQTQAIQADLFKPFGTFLICFDSECICFEDPEAVLELLVGDTTDGLVDWRDYGEILDRLDQSLMTDSSLMIDDVIDRMEERGIRKKLRFDQLKKLNDMKISLMHIEWYKKMSKMNKIGYYDRYKARVVSSVDIDLEKRKKELNEFWISMVEEVEKKPQSEKSILKKRCLFGGNNYRRMIEPLDIAEYYLDGRKDYRTLGRSRHYVMLEKWFEAENIETVRCKKRDLSDLLTFDSCFWAEVEESLIVTNQLETQVGITSEERAVLTGKLERFEAYVWGMIEKREVSPEIFLEDSSFMKWWTEYKVIKGFNSPPSLFTEFMNTWKYESYGQPQ